MQKACLSILLCFAFAWLFGLTGTGDSAPMAMDTVFPSLSIITPNGGEAWYIGDTNNILWSASDPNLIDDSVYLWYSLNNGTDYEAIAEGIINDGSEPWTMPPIQTYNAKIRIRVADSFGNVTQHNSASVFSITFVPPASPEGVTVDISNLTDAVITWLPVTQTIYGSPVTPDGYIVLYNETPYEDDQFYYFLAETSGLSHTHQRVAQFRDQMYYRVIAYKDFGDMMRDVLSEVAKTKDKPVSLAEIKARLVDRLGGEK